MATARDYKETIRSRVNRDPAFREALLKEALECFFAGEMLIGKAVLKDFIKATVGFKELARLLDKKPESLIRMLGPQGNPTAYNLFQIVALIQEQEGIKLQINCSKDKG